MNNKQSFHIRGRWVFFVTMILLLMGMRGEGYAIGEVSEPVWGRKPVLAYFALTASLTEDFKAGAQLSEAEFSFIQQVARQEAEQLKGLLQLSQAILQDETTSPGEKQDLIARSDYNEAVRETITATNQALQNALSPETYTRLVTWIEARWLRERILHGTAQQSTSPTAARTYSIYATHFDSNGSYAIALPDKCVKFADGGNSICEGSGYATGPYMVRLIYDETITVSSFDSGPWNVDDNFWARLRDPHPRRLFTDLPLGMPEAQAAYFDDYNDGRDQYGRTVTAPFAIDLGDGVGSDIGLNPGFNDWIEVAFQWTDGWDSLNPQVVTLFAPTDLEPPYTGDMCVTAWHRLFPLLREGGQAAYLTLNVDDPAQSTNSAEWRPDLPVSGEYQVLAFIPNHGPINWLCPVATIEYDTSDAEYTIHHAEGETSVSRNQRPMANQYLDLGTYEFDAGNDGWVELSDLNDEANLSRTVAFSAMQFRQILPPPTATPPPTLTASPTPTQTPTPTPSPGPMVRAGQVIVPPGANLTIPIHAMNLQMPGLGQAVVDVQFNPAIVNAIDCQPDPNHLFTSATCDPDYEADNISPDAARITLNSAEGIAGNPLLANLTFEAVGGPGDFTWLELFLIQFVYPGGGEMYAATFDGAVCLSPCENMWFLTLIFK